MPGVRHSHPTLKQFKPDARGSARDSRSDLGYGKSDNLIQHPRSSQSSYPYTIDDKEEELKNVEPDIDSIEAIAVKTPSIYVGDPMANRSTDHFYFSGGNVKLSDCFFRTDYVLSEIAALANSMSPIPVPRPTSRLTGGGASFPSSIKKRPEMGSGKGYASAPPLPKISAVFSYEEEDSEEDPVYSLEDLVVTERTMGCSLPF